MQRFALVLLPFALVLMILPAWAGQSTNDKIRQLIEMDGAQAVTDGVIDRQRPLVRKSFLAGHPGASNKMADAYVDAFAAELTVRRDEFLDLIVAVYAKTFTAEEIDGLLAFHASPLGQKARSVAPSILLGGRQAGAIWGKTHGAAVAAAAMAKLKAMGYTVK